ncbi:MAG: plasmid pRiA4b ORF-3 family protein [Anaerolineae bacterium]|nr:plasmid pRiA4b ORF-3 family protein [Anaerolineae bacterium]
MPMQKKARGPATVYQLKITLVGSKPPIWRRVLVTDDTRLSTLHQIIQAVMPWENAHLHQFVIAKKDYTDPAFELDDAYNERVMPLSKLGLKAKSRFKYEYDFGDSWEHEIRVEKVLDPDPEVVYPRCTEGERAGPPDDCGGIWGYYRLLEVLKDPSHPDHEDMLEWVGEEPIDPDAFDVEKANARLQQRVRRK